MLGPAHVGVLASLGLDEVRAHPQVRVGVLATGDELVEVAATLGPGQIHDANRHALLAAVRQSGCEAVDLGIVGDDPAAIGAALDGAVGRCDVVLSSGGVSVGTADYLQAVLDASSNEPARWMEVRIKPGKPFGFALLGPSGLPVLCLPGNPVSAMVVFELLARPALRHLAGHRVAVRPPLAATASTRLERAPDGKVHYLRVVTRLDEDGTLWVRPAGGQSSHQLHALADADALAIVPDGPGIAAGEPVRVLVLRADGPGLDGTRRVTGAPPVAVEIRGHPSQPTVPTMPEAGPLVDRFGRVHRDLRLSVTDRCNLRCAYCLPEDGVTFQPREEHLELDEIVRVARVAHDLGVTSIRITGGEPLLRRGVVDLVARLATIGFDDLSLTTNGTGLARLAPALAEAGLDRVNVSCDSLRPERFASIRRRGRLAPVLEAMDAAERAGLGPVKVNVVLLAGVNDDEVLDFAALRPVDRSHRPLHRVHAARRRRRLAARPGRARSRRPRPDRCPLAVGGGGGSGRLGPGGAVPLRRRRWRGRSDRERDAPVLRHVRPAAPDRGRVAAQLPVRRAGALGTLRCCALAEPTLNWPGCFVRSCGQSSRDTGSTTRRSSGRTAPCR